MQGRCMKYQILFPGKNKNKNISKCFLLKFLPNMQSIAPNPVVLYCM